MTTIHVTGGSPLRGSVHVRGAKNFVSKAMVAALLGETTSTLRDVPGIAVAVASHPHTAPALLRACLDLARAGRVCVFVEPIARYHSRDDLDLDYGDGRDLLMLTFGNGVFMSLRVARTLRAEGIGCTVLDLGWLAPLPTGAITAAASGRKTMKRIEITLNPSSGSGRRPRSSRGRGRR